MAMAYTILQHVRKMRARNKGANRRLASTLRRVATWLDRQGPEELSRLQIRQLQNLREMITTRLAANAVTKLADDYVSGRRKVPDPTPRGEAEILKHCDQKYL